MPYEPAPGLTLWRRDELGLHGPVMPVPTVAQKSELIVHHSGGEELGRVDFAAWWRSIYQHHTRANRWADIGYNFGVANDPRDPHRAHILEGRGWTGVGAHTPGHNSSGLGVCYLRNGVAGDGVKRAFRFLLDDASKSLGRPLRVLGHCDTFPTACPGDLISWVREGMNVGPFDDGRPGLIEGLNAPVTGLISLPTGEGYWLVAADGGVFAFGDAGFYGSLADHRLNSGIVGGFAHPGGGGYWLVAADGGVFAFGDAGFYGSMGSRRLNHPVVGGSTTPTGEGYWLIAADGGVFAFGDAGFYGSPVK